MVGKEGLRGLKIEIICDKRKNYSKTYLFWMEPFRFEWRKGGVRVELETVI